MSELSKLPNVGKVLEKHLHTIGIETANQLREMGTEETFIRIRLHCDDGACLSMLYGIQGAIEGVPGSQLSIQTKQKLKEFYKSIQ